MTRYLMSTEPPARRRGSRGQQRIQPRQTDDVSSLFELEVVRDEWCDDGGTTVRILMSTGPLARRRGSGGQQWIQPRQPDDVLGLFELEVVRNERGNNDKVHDND